MTDTTSPRAFETQVLCETPRITLTPGVIGTELAATMRHIAMPRLGQALVSDAAAGTASDGRTCHTCWFPHDANLTVRTIVDLVSAVAGFDASLAEQLHVIRYLVGGQYKPHFDAYRIDTEAGRRCTSRRGQRMHTAILYLNDAAGGGATMFPRLGIEVPAVAGTVLTFENCVRGTVTRDEKSLHAGSPVEQGEKWIATLWFRERTA